MVDWITTKITSPTKDLPDEHAIATRLRLQRRGRFLEMLWDGDSPLRAGRLQPTKPSTTTPARSNDGCNPQDNTPAPVEVSTATEARVTRLDDPTRRQLAVTAFAMGISTRQIEDLLRVILGEEGPDHTTIGRWVADAAKTARSVLKALDAACIPKVSTLAVDEIFLGAADFGRDRTLKHDGRLL